MIYSVFVKYCFNKIQQKIKTMDPVAGIKIQMLCRVRHWQSYFTNVVAWMCGQKQKIFAALLMIHIIVLVLCYISIVPNIATVDFYAASVLTQPPG
jgi:hypothetical protein